MAPQLAAALVSILDMQLWTQRMSDGFEGWLSEKDSAQILQEAIRLLHDIESFSSATCISSSFYQSCSECDARVFGAVLVVRGLS